MSGSTLCDRTPVVSPEKTSTEKVDDDIGLGQRVLVYIDNVQYAYGSISYLRKMREVCKKSTSSSKKRKKTTTTSDTPKQQLQTTMSSEPAFTNKMITSFFNQPCNEISKASTEDGTDKRLLEEIASLPSSTLSSDKFPGSYIAEASHADEVYQSYSRADPRSPSEYWGTGRLSHNTPLTNGKEKELTQPCLGCGKPLSLCHNSRFGPYTVKRTLIYFIDSNCELTPEIACSFFRLFYSEALRYQTHDCTKIMDMTPKFEVPECMVRSSLAYVINFVRWRRQQTGTSDLEKSTLLAMWTPPSHKYENWDQED